MMRFALICSFAALPGCAARHTPYPITDNWAFVQRVPPGTQVVVRVAGAKHLGFVDAVTADSIALRGKDGLTSIARHDIVRVSQRVGYPRPRTWNNLTDVLVFSIAAPR